MKTNKNWLRSACARISLLALTMYPGASGKCVLSRENVDCLTRALFIGALNIYHVSRSITLNLLYTLLKVSQRTKSLSSTFPSIFPPPFIFSSVHMYQVFCSSHQSTMSLTLSSRGHVLLGYVVHVWRSMPIIRKQHVPLRKVIHGWSMPPVRSPSYDHVVNPSLW
jgi:hypothetical protein